MASNLLRTSALRGSAFYRALSAEAAAAPLGRQELPATRWAHPIRRLSQSSAPGGPPLKSLDDKVCKVDELQRQVQEITQLVERDIAELVERYRDFERCDHGYLERYFAQSSRKLIQGLVIEDVAPLSYLCHCLCSFLSKCGIAKSKFRDDLIWHGQISTLFVLSGGVGYLLAEVEGWKK
ncbi:unnamed protein product [Urochloa decumbens]|uniref:Uncharacterized protein n=1 Tax=Urochloa decumbens TaxID=240449 RepID=A0ABC8VG12_9POAL